MRCLSEAMRLLSKYLRAADNSTEELSSSKITRKDQMNTILKEKVQEVNQNAWKLRFGNGNNVPLKDAIQPIIGIIESANEFIGKVASVNPYASLAWSGVSILLPVGIPCQRLTVSTSFH